MHLNNESKFSRLGRILLKHPAWVWVGVIAISLACAHQIHHKLVLDSSPEAFVPENSPAQKALEKSRAIFGNDDIILVMAKGDVFSLPFLDALKQLQNKFSDLKRKDIGVVAVGHNEKVFEEITSLVNVLGPSEEPMQAFKVRVLANSMLVDNVVSADGHFAAMALRIPSLSPTDGQLLADAVSDIAKKTTRDDFSLTVAGMPILNANLNTMINIDLRKMLSLAGLLMVGFLVAMLREIRSVMGSFIVVGLSALWTFGFMAFAGYPVTLMSNMLPAFLTCVSIGNSVHLVSIFQDRRRKGASDQDAICMALGSAGEPIVYTSLTTMVGLLSLRTSSMEAISQMGTAGAVGAGISALLAFLVLPIALRNVHINTTPEDHRGRVDRSLMAALDLSFTKRGRAGVLIGALIIAIVSVIGMRRLELYHDPLSWMPKGNPLREAFMEIDTHMGGVAQMTMLVETKTDQGLNDPELLKALSAMSAEIAAYVYPKDGQSLVTHQGGFLALVESTYHTMMPGADVNVLFDNPQMLTPVLGGLKASNDPMLRRYITEDFKTAQLQFRIRWRDASAYEAFSKHTQAAIDKHIGSRATISPTGVVYTLASSIAVLIGNLVSSFGIALVMITALLMMALRSVRWGLVAMIPNLLPIMMVLGMMGFLGIPIDMMNLLIASIAIGIAVDDTIHFVHHVRVGIAAGNTLEHALHQSMHDSGRAIVAASVVLIAGFGIYTASSMTNLQRFGLLVACTIFFALIADLVLSPAVLRFFFLDKKVPVKK